MSDQDDYPPCGDCAHWTDILHSSLQDDDLGMPNSAPKHQVPPQCWKAGEVWIANGYALRTTKTTDTRVFFEVLFEL